MNPDIKYAELSFLLRLKLFAQSIVTFLFALVVVIYGAIFTTNMMTQLSHAETWLYVTVFISSYACIAVLFAVLFKSGGKRLLVSLLGLQPPEKS